MQRRNKNSQSRKRSSRSEMNYQSLEDRKMLSADVPLVISPNFDFDLTGNLPTEISESQQAAVISKYLNSDPTTAYLQADGNGLELIDVKHGLASTTTHFQRTFNGIAVFESVVTVNQDRTGEVQRIWDSGPEKFTANESVVLVDIGFDFAEKLALDHANINVTFAEPQGDLMWYVDENGEARQTRIITVYGYDNPGDWLTVIDVESGKVIMQENHAAHFENGTGDVFEPNPWQTQGSGTGLSDNNDATSAALEAQLVSVTLEGLDEGTGLIKGEFVDLSTLNSPGLADVDANEPTRVYEYTRDDARFEQVVVYHSVDQINRYFHTLGFDDDSGVANGIRDFATLANAHWDNADNSFYSTGDDAIHFGDGGVDDAEDADIVAHEYGHAVQFNQNPAWGGGEMGAMGEGFGDYLAAAFYSTFGDPAFQASHAAAVGEWDATSYSGDNPPNLRRVDGNKMWPDDTGGGVHADGEIWSRALWDMHNTMGQGPAMQVILEAHFLLGSSASMPQAADAILLADSNINGGANEGAIRAAFEARGILEAPPTQGTVTLNKSSYTPNDSVGISVVDANAVGPFDVTVETSAGDMETVTLTSGGGNTFTGTINTTEGAANAGDGQLNVAIGQTITVTYIDLDDGSGNSNTLTDTAGVANTFEYPSADTPININDNSSIFSTINVPDAGSVADIDVRLNVTHTYTGDLDVFLTSPSGDRLELFASVGGSGDNFVETVLDQEAGSNLVDGSNPFTGEFRPEGDLTSFYGQLATGDWTLEIADTAGGDTGSLNDWALLIDIIPAEVGILSIDDSSYNIGDTIDISVVDSNATAPVEVEVAASGGDMETVTLTAQGGGLYTGSIDIVAGSNSADGLLQGAPGDGLSVTYTDADDGNGNSFDTTQNANIVNVVEFESADIPVNIVDNTTVTSLLTITDDRSINDIDVKLDITHTWDADLDVFLIGPDGTRVELFNSVGGSGDDFTGTVLDDEAATDIGAGAAPFTGSFRPSESLTAFDGMSAMGDWTLEITDTAGGDTGTLNSWSLCVDMAADTTVPVVTVLGPVSVTESDSGTSDAMFEVMLSEPATETVTFDYATLNQAGEEATPGVDYVETMGSGTINIGDTSFMVAVPVIGDQLLELDESFSLAISNVTGADIGFDTASAEITDNENYSIGTQIDFGTDSSPVAGGAIGLTTTEYTAENGIGWLPGTNDLSTIERPRGNALIRDLAQLRTGEFVVDAVDSVYDVTVNLGAILRGGDSIRVTIEGQVFNLQPTTGPNVIIQATVPSTDGQINFEFNGLGLLPFFRVAGIMVEEAPGRSTPSDSGDLANFYGESQTELNEVKLTGKSSLADAIESDLRLTGSIEGQTQSVDLRVPATKSAAADADSAQAGLLNELVDELIAF